MIYSQAGARQGAEGHEEGQEAQGCWRGLLEHPLRCISRCERLKGGSMLCVLAPMIRLTVVTTLPCLIMTRMLLIAAVWQTTSAETTGLSQAGRDVSTPRYVRVCSGALQGCMAHPARRPIRSENCICDRTRAVCMCHRVYSTVKIVRYMSRMRTCQNHKGHGGMLLTLRVDDLDE